MNKASSSGKPSRPLALAFFPANPNRGNGVLLRTSLTHSLSLIDRSVSHLSVLVNSTDAVLAAIASVLKVLHCDPETYGAGGLTWQQAVAAHEGQGAAPAGQGAGRGWCQLTPAFSSGVRRHAIGGGFLSDTTCLYMCRKIST